MTKRSRLPSHPREDSPVEPLIKKAHGWQRLSSTIDGCGMLRQPDLKVLSLPGPRRCDPLYIRTVCNRIVPVEDDQLRKEQSTRGTHNRSISSAYSWVACLRMMVPLPARGRGLPGVVTRIISLKILANAGASRFASSTDALERVSLGNHPAIVAHTISCF